MVRTVCPVNTESDKPEGCLKKRLKNDISFLGRNVDIHTLLIYYCGEYYTKDTNDEGFRLDESEFLSIDELKEMLEQFLRGSGAPGNEPMSSRRFIVFFDCCEAPLDDSHELFEREQRERALVQLKDPSLIAGPIASTRKLQCISFDNCDNYSLVQINACRCITKHAEPQSDRNMFRKLLVQALTRKALNQQCCINTQQPTKSQCKDCGLTGDFVTMQSLVDYIDEHLRKIAPEIGQPMIYAKHLSAHEAKIGYVVNCCADLQFTYSYKNVKRRENVAQQMFSDMSQLKVVIFRRFFGKYKHIVFRKRTHV